MPDAQPHAPYASYIPHVTVSTVFTLWANADKQQDKSIDKEPTEVRSKQELILISWRLQRWSYKKICMVQPRKSWLPRIVYADCDIMLKLVTNTSLILFLMNMQSDTAILHDKEL
jgi:hypothetical protein